MAAARELQSLLASAENAAALEGYYERTVRRILQELAGGVSQPGAARARELLMKIRDLARMIDPRRDSPVRRWIQGEFPKAFLLGDRAAIRQVKEILREVPPEKWDLVGEPAVGFTAVNQTALRAITASLTDRLSDIQRQVLTTAGLLVRRTQLVFQQDAEVREHIVSGIIRGATGREISDDIARAILTGQVSPAAAERLRQAGFAGNLELYKQLSAGQFITVGKARMSVRVYANLVARTMSREAHSIGTRVRLQQQGIDHVRVSETMPLKPDICSLILGQIYFIGPGEDPLGFPSLKEIPGGQFPPHPNCRHVLEPWVAVLKSESQVAAARATSDLVPDQFFGTNLDEAAELVGNLTDKEFRRIAPAAFDEDLPKGRAA